ncbi:MAG: glycosyltransferase family 2 protein [Planctomycetota bacterium]|jgi:glycosyltransferase involved in cell wall biosynthesis
MKVSIIIPIYNAADHIGRCLDSVMLQTYPDIECILVDDCSTDNTIEVIEAKLAEYSGPIEFKMLRREINGSSAATRNTGVSAATGTYLYFIDSDDLITSDAISLLAEPLKNEPLDLVTGDFVDNYPSYCSSRPQIPSGIIRTNQEIFSNYRSYTWPVAVWNKLVRHQFLIDNDISFVEDIRIHEDEIWSFKVACMAQRVGCVNSVTYIYCNHGGSKTNTRDHTRIFALVETSRQAEAFIQEKNLEDDITICRFLMQWRERLGHMAWPYGKNLAYQTYREHVWKHPALIRIHKRFPELKTAKHWHHAMPTAIGFCCYMMCKYGYRKFSALQK